MLDGKKIEELFNFCLMTNEEFKCVWEKKFDSEEELRYII